MAAMASSNMTESGSSMSLARSPSPASDTWSAPILITVADEALRLLVRLPHVQDTPQSAHLREALQSGHLHEALWNAAGAVEQSPQPQPCGCAFMRKEHAPLRRPAPRDRAETPGEQDGQLHDLPWARLHELQEHPVMWAAARAIVLLLLLLTLSLRETEVDDAPPTKLPAGRKKASAWLAARTSAAATDSVVDFMGSTWREVDGSLLAVGLFLADTKKERGRGAAARCGGLADVPQYSPPPTILTVLETRFYECLDVVMLYPSLRPLYLPKHSLKTFKRALCRKGIPVASRHILSSLAGRHIRDVKRRSSTNRLSRASA